MWTQTIFSVNKTDTDIKYKCTRRLDIMGITLSVYMRAWPFTLWLFWTHTTIWSPHKSSRQSAQTIFFLCFKTAAASCPRCIFGGRIKILFECASALWRRHFLMGLNVMSCDTRYCGRDDTRQHKKNYRDPSYRRAKGDRARKYR